MSTNRPLAPETAAAQALHYLDKETGAVAPPIHPSSTFARNEHYDLMSGYNYSRYESPTVDLAEAVICRLENGAASQLFGSGLAAMQAVFETVKPGAHVVVPKVMYFGALLWLRRIAAQKNITITQFDQGDIAQLREAMRPGRTDLVWLETPANPTFEVIDIAQCARVAHDAGAVIGVDGTNAPPCTQRPLELGADISMHSATKYLNGHSDMTGGVITVARKDARFDEIHFIRKQQGAVLGAFEAWLLVRGLRTLFVRFDRASANAMAIASHFEGHAKVERVIYPGLVSHAGHAIAKRQMTGGFGGMLSILTRGGADEARRVCTNVKVFYPATSLGGVESLVEHRKTVEAPDSPIPANLIRMSVGIENVSDLIADFEQALESI